MASLMVLRANLGRLSFRTGVTCVRYACPRSGLTPQGVGPHAGGGLPQVGPQREARGTPHPPLLGLPFQPHQTEREFLVADSGSFEAVTAARLAETRKLQAPSWLARTDGTAGPAGGIVLDS